MTSEIKNIAIIGLGSNVGDRFNNLQMAVSKIGLLKNTIINDISSIYETSPFGKPDQPDFYNAVVKIQTGFNPAELLYELKKIEVQVGRLEREKWGPREIDLDILFFNDLIISDEIITLPHKGIIYRDFVLFPLVEIDPELIHPVYNRKLKDFLSENRNKNIINKLSVKLISENLKLGC